MKLPQISIVKLMAIVGVVALNIPSYIFLMEEDGSAEGFEGCFLMGIALQVGLFCSIRSRRTKFFPFWAGFEVSGVAAAITWIYTGLFAPQDWRIFGWWISYLQDVYRATERICMLIQDPSYRASVKDFVLQDCQNMMFEVATFLPMLLIALIGGSITSLTARCLGNRRDPVVLDPAAPWTPRG